MAMKVLAEILQCYQQGSKMLAVLLDPEKPIRLTATDLNSADLVLIGGSSGEVSDDFMDKIRILTHRPIVLFPGNVSQFNPLADAILFLSLLSGRNPDVLAGQQIAAARSIQDSGIEVIPMGYILIDGGRISSVERASHTTPLDPANIDAIVDIAIAAQLMGKQLVYLEAGSGALFPVSEEIIKQVRSRLHIPLIVGGGIRTPQQMKLAFKAGADVVVIGNHFEEHPEQFPLFVQHE